MISVALPTNRGAEGPEARRGHGPDDQEDAGEGG